MWTTTGATRTETETETGTVHGTAIGGGGRPPMTTKTVTVTVRGAGTRRGGDATSMKTTTMAMWARGRGTSRRGPNMTSGTMREAVVVVKVRRPRSAQKMRWTTAPRESVHTWICTHLLVPRVALQPRKTRRGRPRTRTMKTATAISTTMTTTGHTKPAETEAGTIDVTVRQRSTAGSGTVTEAMRTMMTIAGDTSATRVTGGTRGGGTTQIRTTTGTAVVPTRGGTMRMTTTTTTTTETDRGSDTPDEPNQTSGWPRRWFCEGYLPECSACLGAINKMRVCVWAVRVGAYGPCLLLSAQRIHAGVLPCRQRKEAL
mmetsp:Transcript_35697/g.102551  ORF Transcript_35697/g.102551 Transcript_35697/m.102551 type:complete len:316 (+) Transcript_35697:832-1779(+)